MIRTIACICLYLAAASELGLAQSVTQINMDSGSFQMMNQASSFLTAGPAGDGNGAVLQLGYYTGATDPSNNFTGTWVPLTGLGSANTDYNTTSIGDKNSDTGNTDGTFVLQLFFGNAGSSMNLPVSTNQILSIRFYNGTTLANSTFYNAVSSDDWKWQTPAAAPNSPVITISLDKQNIEWESIVRLGQAGSTAFHTTISAIPEPSTYALFGLGAFGMMVLRRRIKK